MNGITSKWKILSSSILDNIFRFAKICLLQIEYGIKLPLAPKSHKALPFSIFPIVHGNEKLAGYFNFFRIDFWKPHYVHSALRVMVSTSSSFRFLDNISFRNLAYNGICAKASEKGLFICNCPEVCKNFSYCFSNFLLCTLCEKGIRGIRFWFCFGAAYDGLTTWLLL